MTLPRRWIFVCVGLLTANAAVMAVLIVASARSAPTVVPRYYERAVEWDRAMAEERAATRLGWKVEVALAKSGASVTVRDGEGRPLEGARVAISGFQRAHPTERVELEVATGGDGRGVIGVGAPLRAGWYELDVSVERGPVRLELHRAVELPEEAVAAKERP